MTPALRALAWEHIFELGVRHRIKVHRAKSWHRSEAHFTTRQVWVPPRVTDAAKYLIALHEFGHLLEPKARPMLPAPIGYEMSYEAFAWGWAVEHALPELLAAMTRDEWAVIGDCLSSFAHVRSKQRVSDAGYA